MVPRKIHKERWMFWRILIMLVLGRLRQQDGTFEARLTVMQSETMTQNIYVIYNIYSKCINM